VLVVDGHALQTVDFLDLVDEIGSQCLHALNGQNVVRCRVAVKNVLTLFDGVAFLKVEMFAFRDEIFDGIDPLLCRLDDDAALVLVVATEADRAVDFGNNRVILRTASFEQFRNTRKTTGDVLGLGAFQRNTRQNVTGLDR